MPLTADKIEKKLMKKAFPKYVRCDFCDKPITPTEYKKGKGLCSFCIEVIN